MSITHFVVIWIYVYILGILMLSLRAYPTWTEDVNIAFTSSRWVGFRVREATCSLSSRAATKTVHLECARYALWDAVGQVLGAIEAIISA